MPTAEQRDAVRYDLGDPSIEDAEIDALYLRAEIAYPSNTSAAEASVRLLAVNSLLMQAAKRSDYTQNRSSEKLSQVFDHLLMLRKLYRDDLLLAVEESTSSVRMGALRRVTPRVEEYPGDQFGNTNGSYWPRFVVDD